MQKDVFCTPICPFHAFTCYKNALVYRKTKRGLEAFCTWTGEPCIGWKCQFAGCSKHALLPDGTCKFKLEKISGKKEEEEEFSIEEEAKVYEKQVYGKIKDKLKKLGARIDDIE
ncbi:MAG: hypothetical protein JHC26_06490 [Thermofilum sp.]|uniref:hypothetical protein n=1 Tax=Thermofilum sp. TaxID=1961369 RepID=UPI00258CA6D4|nr:hypothetical protein [Thermofilum sp.]MCI4408721.1 hypothetical protein [Thermofilum sp.]